MQIIYNAGFDIFVYAVHILKVCYGVMDFSSALGQLQKGGGRRTGE